MTKITLFSQIIGKLVKKSIDKHCKGFTSCALGVGLILLISLKCLVTLDITTQARGRFFSGGIAAAEKPLQHKEFRHSEPCPERSRRDSEEPIKS